MNKIYLIGNLTRDPELSETPNGIAVCHFSIAVNRQFQSNDGERITDFFNITVWRTQGENCNRYLRKGSKVAVVGSIQFRNYEDKDGIKRQATVVVANEVEFLSTKGGGESTDDTSYTPRQSKPASRPVLEEVDDQLPF